jgi:integrase
MGQALAPGTLFKYSQALNLFLAFCSDHGLRASGPRDVDRHLAFYIQQLYDAGRPFHLASCAVFGLQHYAPWMARDLASAKLALKGWLRLHPSKSHSPLTWELTCLLSVWMALRGERAAALAMLVGFDCYLRISEILGLKVRDVAFTNDSRLGSAYRGVMLRLAKTKTGANQAVTVEHAAVAALLQAHVRDRPANEFVFRVSRTRLYALLHAACAAFGLSGHGYTPHSLRHGGATRHFLQGRSIADIQFRGRWSNAKSVRTYIQSGRALLLLTRVDAEVFAIAADCARVLRPLFTLLDKRSRSSLSADASQ